MIALKPTCKPRLAVGCRWSESAATPNAIERMLLFPEGAIRVEGTGRAILEFCNGELTVNQIVRALQQQYGVGESSRIQDEVVNFLQQLHEQRVVDY